MTVLSLAMPCWYYDKQDLRRTPSILGGLEVEKENRYRREGARFIINMGTNMRLRYDTMATGVVYFHRFYMFHTFKQFPRYITACCCLFLAGKVEETPKKCKDVIENAKNILNDTQFAEFGEDPKEEMMTLERILLQTIKFDLQVEHPYVFLLKYAKGLEGDKASRNKMVQMAWTFVNDSLCTTLCLQWESEVIAIALMYLAGKLSKFEVTDWIGKTSKHKYWWDIHVEGMSMELLEDICHQVLDLYSYPKNPSQDSPPATPPSKASLHKTPPPVPVVMKSPVPAKILKESVPVGQPIPRLEPGELKRKTPKKKDASEAKGAKPVISQSGHKKAALVPQAGSPSKFSTEPDVHVPVVSAAPTPPESENKTIATGQQIPTVDSIYKAGLTKKYSQMKSSASVESTIGASSVAVTAATLSSNPLTPASTTSSYLPFGGPVGAAYSTSEGSVPFYLENKPPPPVPQQPYPPLPLGALPHHSSQPPPPLPTNTSIPPPNMYSDKYRPLSHPSSPAPPHPPPFPPAPGASPLRPSFLSMSTPPPPPPASSVLQVNVNVPPPTPASMAPPPNPPLPTMVPPPPHHMGPRANEMSRTSMPPHPGRPLHPPTQQQDMSYPPPMMGPLPPYGPSRMPDQERYPMDAVGEPGPSSRLPMHGPPRYMHSGPPPPLDYPPMDHYDMEQPMPYYRGSADHEYDSHSYGDMPPYYGDEYRDMGPYDYEEPPPMRRYGLGHQGPIMPDRGPMPMPPMKHMSMDTPTGIPHVRITGRYNNT